MSSTSGARRAGRVIAFDTHVGLGTIESDGAEMFLFHCIEIADGTRTIAVGAQVDFVPVAKFGHYEGADIRQ